MLLLSMMTLLHYHITNISRHRSHQTFPTQLGNNLVYFIYRSGSHNLSRRHTSSEWGPSHPQGGDNWSSFLLFGDNWKISISLRLNSTVSSNEPIECQWRTNVNITDYPVSTIQVSFVTFLTRMLTQVVLVVVMMVVVVVAV